MKRILIAVAVSVCAAVAAAQTVSPPTTFYYGDIALTGVTSGNTPQVWNLVNCPLTIKATADLTGLSDAAGAHAWAQLGARAVGLGNFNPTWMVEGGGVWFSADYDWTAGTFGPDPATGPVQDLDDKLLLQKAGGIGEAAYNLPSTPPSPGNNHRVWFDRDGVDQWQAQSPLAVNGGTYNTDGRYDIVLTLTAIDAGQGTAYMTINGLPQGFETDGNWNTMELSPAGMTWTGDMSQQQIFYGLWGYGATHSVVFEDVIVSGCLMLQDGMATGGGWFFAEDTGGIGNVTPGGKATFGFVAKQSDGTSTGELEFQYKTDNLNLKSTSYDWATIAAGQAMFEGTGTINGSGEYKFRVRAVDGDRLGTGTDRFEIRIWTGTDAFDAPTHRAEGDLAGGQIVVHKK